MRRFNALHRVLARLLAAIMVMVSLMSASAQAAMVSTEQLIEQDTLETTRSDLKAMLDREGAMDKLLSLGVDPAQVEQRINQMTAEEMQAFNAQLEELQAGGSSVLGIVLGVILVLVILDLLGATDVFPAVQPINSGK